MGGFFSKFLEFFQKLTKKQWIIIGISGGVLLAGLVTGGILLGRASMDEKNPVSAIRSSGALKVSGFIEAETLSLAPEMGGRIGEITVSEGDEVSEGQLLLQIDTSIIDAQREIALANLDLVKAERDLMAAGARDEIIEQARIGVEMAEAAVDAATVVLGDAYALQNNPQEIIVQVIDAETQVAMAMQSLTAAQIQFDMVRIGYEMANSAIEQIHDLREQGIPAPDAPIEVANAQFQYQEAEANLQSANDALAGTQGILTSLQSLVDNPSAIQLQVADASASLATAKAALEGARADLALTEAGATDSQMAIADARVAEAQATLDSIDILTAQFQINAPIGGIILTLPLHTGEIAAPGIAAVTMANLDTVEVTVYLTAVEFSEVQLNDTVSVLVDSYPDRVFTGKVIQIADEAEFTPGNIQTGEERVNLVYAVKIRIENENHALKPGMPADILFESPEVN